MNMQPQPQQPQRVLECSLWIGDLDVNATEADVRAMFAPLGEPIRTVRILRDRATGSGLGYGFISFDNDEAASGCLMRCHGKPVPGTNGTRRFKLNYSKHQSQNSPDEVSAFVGELSEDLTDLDLFNAFRQRYASVRWAKIMTDESGRPRGFGFVRFGDESDFQRALVEMNGCILGSRAIRVSHSTSRKGGSSSSTATTTRASNASASASGSLSPNSKASHSHSLTADAYAQPANAASYYGMAYPNSQYGYGASVLPSYPAGYSAAEAYAYYAAQYASAQQMGDAYSHPPPSYPPSTAPYVYPMAASQSESPAHSPNNRSVDGPDCSTSKSKAPAVSRVMVSGIEALYGFASAATTAEPDVNSVIDPDAVYHEALSDSTSCAAWLNTYSDVGLFDRLQSTRLGMNDQVLRKCIDAELADYGTA